MKAETALRVKQAISKNEAVLRPRGFPLEYYQREAPIGKTRRELKSRWSDLT